MVGVMTAGAGSDFWTMLSLQVQSSPVAGSGGEGNSRWPPDPFAQPSFLARFSAHVSLSLLRSSLVAVVSPPPPFTPHPSPLPSPHSPSPSRSQSVTNALGGTMATATALVVCSSVHSAALPGGCTLLNHCVPVMPRQHRLHRSSAPHAHLCSCSPA